MTRAPKVPVTGTICVPGAAAAFASIVTFSVTIAEVFEFTTRIRMAANLSGGLREHGLEVDFTVLRRREL